MHRIVPGSREEAFPTRILCYIFLYFLIFLLSATTKCMARKRTQKRSRYFVALPFRTQITLATLNSGIVLATGTLSGNFTEDFQVVSVDSKWTLGGYTAGNGPISVGYAHNDYSVTEIKEALEVNLLGPANKIEQERARRLVRDVGMFDQIAPGSFLNNGVSFRTKLNWLISDGFELDVYAFNEGPVALDTGSVVTVAGKIYGYWRI